MKRIAFRTPRGFTLVELMIALAVAAILTVLALPAYREQVRRAQRVQARAVMMDAAQFMQRFYAANDRYDQMLGATPPAGAVALPASLRSSPPGQTASYAVALQSATRTGFVLAATPVGAMVGDRCGTLTLTQAGEQGVTGGETVANCWR